jgi:hypothetical protein
VPWRIQLLIDFFGVRTPDVVFLYRQAQCKHLPGQCNLASCAERISPRATFEALKVTPKI